MSKIYGIKMHNYIERIISYRKEYGEVLQGLDFLLRFFFFRTHLHCKCLKRY